MLVYLIILFLSGCSVHEVNTDSSNDCDLNYWSKVDIAFKSSTIKDFVTAWKKCLGKERGTPPPATLKFKNCEELMCSQLCTRTEIITVSGFPMIK